MAFHNFLKSNKIYTPAEMIDIIDLYQSEKEFEAVSTNKTLHYINISCAFDIETSSFYSDGDKTACMYEWTFGFNGSVCIGREWSEFIHLLRQLSDLLDLNKNKRLIIYVHNLGYEFQFLRKWLKWKKVFSIENRKPIYAVCDLNIEFRCSYLLSGYSLENLGHNLQKYPVQKMVGDLDYEKIRHSKTPLTSSELSYCVNDVKVVLAYIQERIEADGDISRIPLTKTGYVRNYCRNMCFYTNGIPRKKSYKRAYYTKMIKALHVDIEEYKQLKRAFQGGFTHANAFRVGKVINDVTSYDFTSSYPTVLIAEKFPISSAERIDITNKDDFYHNLKCYCCLFDVEIIGLKPALFFENPLSLSRCWSVENPVVNNGRVVSADRLYTTLTEQDYLIIRKFYKWETFKIANFRRYKKGYLPTDFIKAILKLYADKTTLKGVDGKEAEYLNSKEMLNSCYGMCVTDIVRDEIVYDYNANEWLEDDTAEETPDEMLKRKEAEYQRTIKQLNDYNKSTSRFLFYPWGVWVTAYARRNLFSGILEFQSDYIYSDTDSVKVVNAENHIDYINRYNQLITAQLYKAMDFHGIDRGSVEPLTIKGDKKTLGVWDFDGHYKRFKTLGAKRYITEYSDDTRNGAKKGKISITVSGLNKTSCVPYLLEKYGTNGIFDAFNDELYIPPEYTGKNTHTYIDTERAGAVTDYFGYSAPYFEKSAVHLEKSDYSLSMGYQFTRFLLNINDTYI